MKTRVVHFKKSAFDVYIGRPGPFGNPFQEGIDGTRSEVIVKYEEWLRNSPEMLEKIKELRGKILGCWCKPLDCHGDIIVKLLQEQEQDKLLDYGDQDAGS